MQKSSPVQFMKYNQHCVCVTDAPAVHFYLHPSTRQVILVPLEDSFY